MQAKCTLKGSEYRAAQQDWAGKYNVCRDLHVHGRQPWRGAVSRLARGRMQILDRKHRHSRVAVDVVEGPREEGAPSLTANEPEPFFVSLMPHNEAVSFVAGYGQGLPSLFPKYIGSIWFLHGLKDLHLISVSELRITLLANPHNCHTK